MIKGDLLAVMAKGLQGIDGPLGVAVSGGGDSLAALSLAARVLPGQVQAATVDHRLRIESGAEAAEVGLLCQGLGLAHRVLVWDHGALAGNLQDQARRARYDLLAAWARVMGLGAVVLGHTAEDQAECLLMGLARAAGLDGLAGMRPRFTHEGVTFLRPLLTVRREELRDDLRRQNLAWIEDPSNDDPRFTRVRLRQAMAALGPLGLTVESLAASASHLAQARQALDQAAAAAFAQIGREEAGTLWLDAVGLDALPMDLQRRLLGMALRWVAGADHGPRGPALGRALAAVLAGKDATVHGARLRSRGAMVQITRESKALSAHETPTTALWDNRWRLEGPHSPDLTLRALGAEGLRLCPEWRATGLPREALMASPAVWRGGDLMAAPLAGLGTEWRASCRPFHLFIISH